MESEGALQTEPAGTGVAAEEADEHATGHVHYPALSMWPITMALGITLLGMGFVTSRWLTYVGLVVMFIALVNWVQELRHEQH